MELEKTWLETIWNDRQKRLILGLCLLLTAGVAAVYGRVVGFDFVDYDDLFYVARNPHVLAGLTWDGVKWAFAKTHVNYWCPMTWLSFMLDREIFGVGAWGFHLTNVLLHIADTLLLFWVLMRYTKALWASFFVAALFGLHPLHVESVAWVTERKDVLSTFFWMLAMLAYVRFLERRTAWRYTIMLVAFALGLMAKPMVISLPFVLLLMDYWPLRRFRPQDGIGIGPFHLILEKIPLLALSAMAGVVTSVAQKTSMADLSVFSLGYRISNALVSYCDYILKMFWPVKLAVFYPHPSAGIAGWKIAVSAVVLLVITVIVILLRRHRYLLAGWLWYLGVLVPVIGFVQVGRQAMADRYAYIPLTGIFIMLIWSACDIVGNRRYRQVIAGIGGTAIVGALGVMTFVQVGYWRNNVTLFTHTSAVTTDNYLAYSDLATQYALNGDFEKAKSEIEKVMKANVREIDVLYNVAKCLEMMGRPEEAIEYYNRILAITPGDTDTYSALAAMESNRGNFQRAIDLCRNGLRYHPENGDLHGRLGSLLLQTGLVDEAIKEMETAIKFGAESAVYGNLGVAMLSRGDLAKAAGYFNSSIKLNPANAEAHYNLGNTFLAQDLPAKAVGEYQMAIKVRPNYAKAYCNLGVAFLQIGRFNEAIKGFRRAIELDPNSSDAHFNLAVRLSDSGSIDEAVEHMRKGIELAPQDLAARCRLAEMLLLQDKVEQATAEYEKVLKIDPANEDARAGLEKIRTGNTASVATPVK
jgi:tetratricopeptide (TPR) repeat protein